MQSILEINHRACIQTSNLVRLTSAVALNMQTQPRPHLIRLMQTAQIGLDTLPDSGIRRTPVCGRILLDELTYDGRTGIVLLLSQPPHLVVRTGTDPDPSRSSELSACSRHCADASARIPVKLPEELLLVHRTVGIHMPRTSQRPQTQARPARLSPQTLPSV